MCTVPECFGVHGGGGVTGVRAGCWGTAGMCRCAVLAGVQRVLDLPKCAWGILLHMGLVAFQVRVMPAGNPTA